MLEKALALEGGSLRCMFSAGAVDVMMEQGLLFDGVFGVSAGALTGINYVSRQIGRTARINLEYVNDKRYLGVRNLLLHRSIFNFDFMFGELSDHLIPLDREAVRTTPCRFTAVATDCRTGQTVYFEKSATPESPSSAPWRRATGRWWSSPPGSTATGRSRWPRALPGCMPGPTGSTPSL